MSRVEAARLRTLKGPQRREIIWNGDVPSIAILPLQFFRLTKQAGDPDIRVSQVAVRA